jgi:hypothetical protein
MTTAPITKTDRLTNIILGLFVILFLVDSYLSGPLLCRYIELAFNRYPYTLAVGYVLIVFLPVAGYLFYKREKTGYMLVLFYVAYSLVTSTLFDFNLLYFLRLLFHGPVGTFMILFKVFILALLLRKEIREKYGIKRTDIIPVIATSFIFSPSIITSFIALLALPAAIILLIVLGAWDNRLYRRENPALEYGVTISELYATKLKITLLPFLLLIPLYYLVLNPMLGHGVYSADAWGYLYNPSKYYGFASYMTYILPMTISFTWFHTAIKKKPYLQHFGHNFYWTVFLGYAVLISIIEIVSLANW